MFISDMKSMARGARREIQHRRLLERLPDIDAFLVSYPKSGRTWLRFALSHYFAEVAQIGFSPDLASTFQLVPNFDRDRFRGLPAFIGKRDGLPLIAVSHLSYDPSYFGHNPIVMLVRDPRDVMVSSYFHATRHKHRYEGDIGPFLRDRDQGLANLIRYLNGWSESMVQGRSVLLSYEVMSEDPAHEIERLLGFLQMPVDRLAMDSAVAASGFEAMRKIEQRNGIPGHDYDRSDAQSLRMRKGKVGGYADHLSPDDQAYIMDECNRRLTPQARSMLIDAGVEL